MTQNVSIGLAVYSFVSSAIGAYEGGASVPQSIGIGIISGSASYLGARFGMDYMGGPLGAWLGSNFLGSMGAEIGTAAIMGGDIGRAALAGVAGGAASAFATPIVGGGVASVIHGGTFGAGALEGLYGSVASATVVASAVASGNWTAAQDVARASGDGGPSSAKTVGAAKKIADDAVKGKAGRGNNDNSNVAQGFDEFGIGKELSKEAIEIRFQQRLEQALAVTRGDNVGVQVQVAMVPVGWAVAAGAAALLAGFVNWVVWTLKSNAVDYMQEPKISGRIVSPVRVAPPQPYQWIR